MIVVGPELYYTQIFHNDIAVAFTYFSQSDCVLENFIVTPKDNYRDLLIGTLKSEHHDREEYTYGTPSKLN